MKISLKRTNIIATVFGALVLLIDFYFLLESFFFVPLIVVAILIIVSPFYIDFLARNKRQKEMEEAFPDFVRNLVSAIRSGMPLSKAIIHIANVDYGILTPYVKKLAKQVEWDIPVRKALHSFANNTGNIIIKRTIATVIEAERAGGNIEDVLESVTDSVVRIKKMKESRRAGVHSSLVQNYVIFVVFLATMIVVQNLIMPYVSGVTQFSVSGEAIEGTTLNTGKVEIDFSSVGLFFSSLIKWAATFNGIVLMIGLIQGFFSGIILGKMAEGVYKAGIKHSVTMMVIAFISITVAQSFL